MMSDRRVGFALVGAGLPRRERSCSRRRPRYRPCVASIPGLEWVLFFALVNRYGSGAPKAKELEKKKKEEKKKGMKLEGVDVESYLERVDGIAETSEVTCKCGSDEPYTSCCMPFHSGRRRPESPEELLRARFTAYVHNLPEFILFSTSKECEDWVDHRNTSKWLRWRRTVQEFCESAQPRDLVIEEEKVSRSGKRAYVIFRADLLRQGEPFTFVEKSQLAWSDDSGFQYVDGTMLDVID